MTFAYYLGQLVSALTWAPKTDKAIVAIPRFYRVYKTDERHNQYVDRYRWVCEKKAISEDGVDDKCFCYEKNSISRFNSHPLKNILYKGSITSFKTIDEMKEFFNK